MNGIFKYTFISIVLSMVFGYSLFVGQNKMTIMRETGPYLTRWHIVPENSRYNVYLHKFTSSDFDEALHDHPWSSIGVLLSGSYKELVPKNITEWNMGSRETITIIRKPFMPVYREPGTVHKIELINDDPVWTLFLTGPKVKSWSFWCNKGPVDHKDFLDELGTNVGIGCS
jgi:hypothetical protein